MGADNKLNGLHMVVAVTQDSVNYQFSLLHEQDIIRKKLDIVLTDDIIALHADLGSATVIFGLKDDPRSVLFILTIPKGIFTYWKGFGPDAKKTIVDFANWSYAFHVSLDMQELSKEKLAAGKAVPKVVKDHLDTFGNANFTIQQLFMDFQNANLADWDVDHSSMVFPDGAKIDDSQLAQFQKLLGNHFKSLKDTDNPFILGYTINARATGAPSALDPTSSTFSTVKDPSRPGNSTLNFLLMTGNQALPANPGLFEHNWVIPADVDGVMVIAHTLFWEGWILPSLGAGNTITAGGPGSWTIKFNDPGVPAPKTANDGTPYTEKQSEDRETQVALTSEPGKLRLALSGTLVRGDEFDWKKYGSWAWYYMYGRAQWNAKTTLSPGANGQLALSKDSPASINADAWVKSGGISTLIELNEDQFKAHVAELAKTTIERMQIKALDQRLVLPAGGVFFFKNIRVDDAGDVQFDVSFKS